MSEVDQVKYERDFLLLLILDEEEFGLGAFERAVEKVQQWRAAAEEKRQ